MRAKQLIEPVPRRTTPQCGYPNPGGVASPRQQDAVIKYGFNPEQCMRYSTVELDGVAYCRTHAGNIALAALLDNGEP